MPRAAPPPRPSTRSPPARSSRTTPRGNRKPPPPALPTAIRASVPLPLVSAQLVLSSQRCQAPTHERSEEHTSELQSLLRISYAVFCLTKKKHQININLRILNQPNK